jgi:glycosyltransferase involved in cell wall biosynthesis
MPPLFSIGVTTFDRLRLLRATINSILRQNFTDFEIIISNDNPQRKLTKKFFKIQDPRVKIINQSENLGEVKNMNFLLNSAKGKYFTWLGDDDMYQAQFFEAIHQAIMKFNSPSCIVTSYSSGNKFTKFKRQNSFDIQILSGQNFLFQYLNKSLKIIGCYGVFKTTYLKKIGGIQQLGQGFSPYADNLLAIQASSLNQVVIVKSPLLFYRTHLGSLSLISTDLNAYLTAQEDLLTLSIKIFKQQKLRQNFSSNLSLLLGWCIKDFSAVIIRSGTIKHKEILNYLSFLKKYLKLLRKTAFYWPTLKFIFYNIIRIVFKLVKR